MVLLLDLKLFPIFNYSYVARSNYDNNDVAMMEAEDPPPAARFNERGANSCGSSGPPPSSSCRLLLFLGMYALILVTARVAAKDYAMAVAGAASGKGMAVGASAAESPSPLPPAADSHDPPAGNNHNVIKSIVEPATVEASYSKKTVETETSFLIDTPARDPSTESASYGGWVGGLSAT